MTFLKFIYSVTGSHKFYSLRHPKKLATLLILLSRVKAYVVWAIDILLMYER